MKDDEVLIDEVDSETSPKTATEEPSTTEDKDGTADADEETKEEHPPLQRQNTPLPGPEAMQGLLNDMAAHMNDDEDKNFEVIEEKDKPTDTEETASEEKPTDTAEVAEAPATEELPVEEPAATKSEESKEKEPEPAVEEAKEEEDTAESKDEADTPKEEDGSKPETSAFEDEPEVELEAATQATSVTLTETSDDGEHLGKYMLLDRLFKFIKTKEDDSEPINSVLAGYFSKVVQLLINRKQKQIVPYIIGEENRVVESLLRHVYSRSVAEVIHRILHIIESNFEEEVSTKITEKK